MDLVEISSPTHDGVCAAILCSVSRVLSEGGTLVTTFAQRPLAAR